MLIGHYFGQTGSEQTNDEAQQSDAEPRNDDSENVNVELSEVSDDADAVETTTEE